MNARVRAPQDYRPKKRNPSKGKPRRPRANADLRYVQRVAAFTARDAERDAYVAKHGDPPLNEHWVPSATWDKACRNSETGIRLSAKWLPLALWQSFSQGLMRDPEEVAFAVWEAYIECPLPTIGLPVNAWVALFRFGGFTVNGRRQESERPTEALKLFRAAGPGYEDRLSWTPDYKLAEEYLARRSQGVQGARISEATVEPSRLLAHVSSYAEHDEWIVEPESLRDWEYVL